MHAHPVGRRTRSAISVLSIAALLVLGSGAAIAAAPRRHLALAGTWSGQYGGAYAGKFTLHWTQSGTVLRGSITLSNPPGKYGISGSVHGTAIKFGAVDVGATYTGSVSGKTMSGRYKSPQGGGSWSAHKTG